jgi:four helix bundle protein
VREANQAQSKPDFISKLSIALKEGHESEYWLQLIQDTTAEKVKDVEELQKALNEIISLLTVIIKTSKQNLQR